jgi:hypothetical protein
VMQSIGMEDAQEPDWKTNSYEGID